VAVTLREHPSGGGDFERLVHDDDSRSIVREALDFLAARLGAAR